MSDISINDKIKEDDKSELNNTNYEQIKLPIWATACSNYIEKNPKKSPQESDREADILFLDLLESQNSLEEKNIDKYISVPKFHQKKNQNSYFLQKLRQETRTRFQHNQTAEGLDREDLEKLWYALKENTSFPQEEVIERINQDHFQSVPSQLPEKCRQFFTASNFMKFDRDEQGRIEIMPFFHQSVRKVNLIQTRLHLSLYDSTGNGQLRERDLENMVYEMIPNLKGVKSVTETFHPFYVIAATRKFCFFLDSKRTGKVAIKDVLTSPILSELYAQRKDQPVRGSDDLLNWFSFPSALSLYEKQLKLDLDHNGMLARSELLRYNNGLTDVFINRVFEEYQTFEGEMDYKSFLDFVLAMESKNTHQSMAQFWRILDVQHKGAIDTFIINQFFRAIITKLEQKDKYGFKIDDIKDEIFDMVKPKLTNCITLDDLIKCGQGDTIISMLTDAKAFFDYDQRESGHHDSFDEDDDEAF